jgi:sucrose-6-phosphate hydrolase SacC (GH32 family)
LPASGACEILLEIETLSAINFGFHLKNSKNERIEFAFDLKKGEFSVDRAKSGIVNFNAAFVAKSVVPVSGETIYNLRVFIDNSSVETFLNGGEAAITDLVFSNEPYNQIVFFTKDNAFRIIKLEIFELK